MEFFSSPLYSALENVVLQKVMKISRIELFAKIFNGFWSLIIFRKKLHYWSLHHIFWDTAESYYFLKCTAKQFEKKLDLHLGWWRLEMKFIKINWLPCDYRKCKANQNICSNVTDCWIILQFNFITKLFRLEISIKTFKIIIKYK